MSTVEDIVANYAEYGTARKPKRKRNDTALTHLARISSYIESEGEIDLRFFSQINVFNSLNNLDEYIKNILFLIYSSSLAITRGLVFCVVLNPITELDMFANGKRK